MTLSAEVNAKQNEFFLETGLGIEYGGAGVQLHLPFSLKDTEVFVAVGALAASSSSNSKSNVELGSGVGLNYFLDRKSSLGFYCGTLNIEKNYDENVQAQYHADYGISIGYKYFFAGKGKSGLSLGVTYNVYDDGHFPFFSVGYRY